MFSLTPGEKTEVVANCGHLVKLKFPNFPFSNSINPDFRFAGMGLACFAWPVRTDTRLD
jgi:hypothetical protein